MTREVAVLAILLMGFQSQIRPGEKQEQIGSGVGGCHKGHPIPCQPMKLHINANKSKNYKYEIIALNLYIVTLILMLVFIIILYI